MLFVGDPLYRPFAPDLRASQAEALTEERPDDLRWLNLRAVNVLVREGRAQEAEALVEKLLETRPSALLAEALLGLLLEGRRTSKALLWVGRVDDFPGPPEERSRLLFTAAQVLAGARKVGEAQALYRRLVEEFPGTSGAVRAGALQAGPRGGVVPAGTAPVGREGAP
jgi:tetratricopeptide (TPR) repeat protein